MVSKASALDLHDGAWLNEPALVIAGGPSLRKIGDLALLDDMHCRVISINRALELPVKADVWTWLDAHFYHWARTGELGMLMELVSHCYMGLTVTRVSNHFPYDDECGCEHCIAYRNLPPHVVRLDWQSGRELGPSLAEGMRVGRDSGFWSFNLAYCLGANPIFLLGYDCQNGSDGKTHWHDGYPGQKPRRKFGAFIEDLNAAGKRCLEEGRDVYNVSPGSAATGLQVLNSISEMREVLGDQFDA